ncbi:L,D-transpeptidase [Marisediminicola sp. LYQ134]|uniref:L,D-transpeptidase n=1 Tax=Marisediminicola sp. LYQ134 TaxID=3391061 RepID=UPI003982EA93
MTARAGIRPRLVVGASVTLALAAVATAAALTLGAAFGAGGWGGSGNRSGSDRAPGHPGADTVDIREVGDSGSEGATDTPTASGDVPPVPGPLDDHELAALPEARYDAVIAGLMATSGAEPLPDRRHTIDGTIALYGTDRATPVATLPALNFLGEPTVVVPLETEGGWARILTPARQALPSENGGTAPAQTSAWIDSSTLDPATGSASQSLEHAITVSVSEQTLTITTAGRVTESFTVGVGTPETPTPTGVTGYLQARYLDPAQNQSVHPVQLTSLHAADDDEPFGGSDGGLIGLHYAESASGAVSHGCIRLSAEAIAAVTALPLGTPITMEE